MWIWHTVEVEMKRRRLDPPRALPADRMFWPGRLLDPNLDPVVSAELVQRTCAERMAVFDRLPRGERDRINDEGWSRWGRR